jgi:hypothetical protein
MHRLIEERGEPVPADELLPSDAFVPPADCSLEELRKLMEPEGLIPGAPAKEAADGR